jgi:hypothetical protein
MTATQTIKVIVLLLLAGGALVPAVFFASEWSREAKMIEAGRAAKPVEMAVDFSKPGKWTGKMSHGYTCFYFLAISLEASPVPIVATTVPSTLPAPELAGLKGRLVVTSSAGERVLDEELSDDPEIIGRREEYRGRLPLGFTRSIYPKGQYDVEVEVTKPAPALAGSKQTLVVQYASDGMEIAVMESVAGAAILSFIVSAIFGLCGALAWRRAIIQGRKDRLKTTPA